MIEILKKAFAPKEIKAAYGALDEAAYQFQNEAFQIIRKVIEKIIQSNQETIIKTIKESDGRTPREWIYSQIGNVAGDILESGRYHMYRGTLSPMGPGPDLLKIFDTSYDVLLQMNAINLDYANEQKQAIRQNIKEIG